MKAREIEAKQEGQEEEKVTQSEKDNITSSDINSMVASSDPPRLLLQHLHNSIIAVAIRDSSRVSWKIQWQPGDLVIRCGGSGHSIVLESRAGCDVGCRFWADTLCALCQHFREKFLLHVRRISLNLPHIL
ncbi:hypothetical protein RRG08_010167 [Elysia crispata]|uniref:Uncharacterized protein n=1 Tax=Elysia crispata TaxID=231223 RepID=A0AAE1AJQ8_9GAST|nr:hypothetical protein RRG08_010167 [Elysia crispata]